MNSDLITAIAEAVVAKLEPHLSGRILPHMMSLQTAAEYLGRSPKALRHLVRSGRIKIKRFDRRIQFDRLELDRWIEAQNLEN